MSDRASVVAALHPDYAVPSRALGGVSLRPAPAVLLAELMLADEAFAALVEDGELLRDDEFLKAMAGEHRPAFERLVAACASPVPALDVRTFLLVAIEAFSASMPLPVHVLFRSAASGDGDGMGVEPDLDDVAVEIVKAAERLSAVRPDAHALSWTRLRFAEAIEAERGRDRLGDAAVATRVGGADQKGWKRFMKAIGR